MQPPRPPPAAVDALAAGSGRCTIHWQRPSPRAPLAASLPHYGTRKARSRLRQSTSRMNGPFAGGFWSRHALLGGIRTLKRNLERDSYVPQIVGRDPDTANVFGQKLDAQEPPSVRMSPTTSLLSKCRPKTKRYPKVARQHHDVQISPKNTAASARKTRGRRTARAQPMAIYMQPERHFMHHTRRNTPR